MRAIALILALCCSQIANAGETWLTVPCCSWHSNRTNDHGYEYNQRNLGLGLEYAYRPDFRLLAGMYRNSIRNDSGYIGVAYLPLNYGSWRAGASLGVISGYELEVVPVLIPTIAYERSSWGINLLVIPQTSQTKTGGAGIQFKIKLP